MTKLPLDAAESPLRNSERAEQQSSQSNSTRDNHGRAVFFVVELLIVTDFPDMDHPYPGCPYLDNPYLACPRTASLYLGDRASRR